MKAIIINISSKYYKEAVKIRIEVFFKGFENAIDLINDEYEKGGNHFVVLKDKAVMGTGRVNIKNKTGIISQMAIHPAYQKKGIGNVIIQEMFKFFKEQNILNITLNARVNAMDFYLKNGFNTVGKTYPSQKTGILHQTMKIEFDEVY